MFPVLLKYNWEIQNKNQGKPEMFTRNGPNFYGGNTNKRLKKNGNFYSDFQQQYQCFFFVTQKRITIDTYNFY